MLNQKTERTTPIPRIIGEIHGNPTGPTLVFLGGIHGNEPSGVFALKKVLDELSAQDIAINGNVYALAGNLAALESGTRFISEDLNRIWAGEDLLDLLNGIRPPESEDQVQLFELGEILLKIITEAQGPLYFMDLHSTSSNSGPFLTVNDSLLNRKFTEQYPTPMILGIEEYLDGPILSFINARGYVSFGFEGGQHDDEQARNNHIAFIYLTLLFSGCLKKSDLDFEPYKARLIRNTKQDQNIYEIFFHYAIQPNEQFKMNLGYDNFQSIDKGESLATSNGETIRSPKHAKIFMPLYQSEGKDGFFLIRKIPFVFLWLSSVMRALRIDKLVALLPGVRWLNSNKDTLVVNHRVARFFAKEIFHVMGYRRKVLDQEHWVMKNRETASRTKDYQDSPWFA